MSKPKTQEQLEHAADLRLQKQYGITLTEYERLAEVHHRGCWVCESVPVTRRLHVDHDHGWKKTEIVFGQYNGLWAATARYNGRAYVEQAKKKSEARKLLKEQLKRASVRGLLCYPHNTGLQKFRDNPQFLRSAANYLECYQNGSTDRILNGGRT